MPAEKAIQIATHWAEIVSMRRVRAMNFGAERRASVRFQTELGGMLDGVPCRVEDLSLTGARVTVERRWALAAGTAGHRLTISLLTSLPPLPVAIRLNRSASTGDRVVGLEFVGLSAVDQARLALALFTSQVDFLVSAVLVPDDTAKPAEPAA